MSGGEKTVEEEEEILLSQRGWFDSAVTREENRKKKVKQVLKMVFFLQVINKGKHIFLVKCDKNNRKIKPT